MADEPTIDDILGPRKDPLISLDDINKVTENSKGKIMDNVFAKKLRSAIEIENIKDGAANRNITKTSSPLEIVDIAGSPTREDEQKDGHEQGE